MVCLQAFVTELPAEYELRCPACVKANRPLPHWVEAWQRSLRIQRALRDADRDEAAGRMAETH